MSTTGSVSAAEAVEASVACARERGLPSSDPQIVAEGYSVRVRLRPAPVVTRVVTEGLALRGEPRPWHEREVAVATHLAAGPAWAVEPWSDPGPHDIGGTDVTLWRWVEHTAGSVTPRQFGLALGELHAALDSYAGELPTLVGPLTDIETALVVSDDPVLHAAAAWLLPLAASWPRRPLHGDAHRGNLLVTTDGPCWIDFEDVCAGPVEWDLASLTLDDEAVDAYPGAVDLERLEECRDLRRLQVLASLLVAGEAGSPLYDRLVGHLERASASRA